MAVETDPRSALETMHTILCLGMNTKQRGPAAWSDIGLPLFLVLVFMINVPLLWVTSRWLADRAKPEERQRVITGCVVMWVLSILPFAYTLSAVVRGFVEISSDRVVLVRAVWNCEPLEFWFGVSLIWLLFLLFCSQALSMMIRLRRTPYRRHERHQVA